MAYVINKTNGDILLNLPDGSLDSSTGLTLVGRNYVGYGELQQENFIKLLENFANSIRPSQALAGQLWYDTSVAQLKYYNGSVFKPISNLTIGGEIAKPTNTVTGDQWFNTDQNEFYIWNGASWLQVGPTDLSRLSRIQIIGTLDSSLELPAGTGLEGGNSYLIAGNLHVWDTERWTNVGRVQGPTGDAGPQGPTGEQGPRGPAGPEGPMGVQGLRGQQGVQGNQGIQGLQGPQGETGASGADGTSVSIVGALSLVSELPESGNLGDAYLILGNLWVWTPSGAWEDVGNIKGPKGDIGNTGPIGLQGLQGIQGVTGPQGPTGPIGPTGPQGSQGPAGPTGPTGAQGPKGDTGSQGATGAQGATGPQGPVGPYGPTGPQGPQGTTAWADLTDKPSFASVATSGDYSDIVNRPALSAVATSGSYADLGDTPTLNFIPQTGYSSISGVLTSSNSSNMGTATARWGTVYANTFDGVATTAQYADVAERFEADQIYEPGTVVALGGAKEITAAVEDGGEDVFGVISTRPAHLMNAAAGNDVTHPAVAISGRVPVKVTGPVRKGQRLISAGNGLARGATRVEITGLNVIGRSLEDKPTDGVGTIEAIVRLNS
jgi:hypothetical protein